MAVSAVMEGIAFDSRWDVLELAVSPGVTVPLRFALSRIGGRYDRDRGRWLFPATVGHAKALVEQGFELLPATRLWLEGQMGPLPVERGWWSSAMKTVPYPFQVEDSWWLATRRSGLLLHEMGLGKAQPVDSLVMTSRGSVRIGDLSVGDKICDAFGGVASVLAVYPQGVKDTYRLTFGDGSSAVSCREHLWAVRTVNDNLRGYRGRRHRVYSLDLLVRAELVNSFGHAKFFLPRHEPVYGEQQSLPIDPYLLGLLLGDGGLSRPGIRFSTADEELIERIQVLLPAGIGCRRIQTYDYYIGGKVKGRSNPLLDALKGLGLHRKTSLEKWIPRIYLTSTVDDRVALLQGLLDTDGYVPPLSNTVEYSTSSEMLARDVRFLVQSLGGVARVAVKQTACSPSYRMTIALPAAIIPFRLTRKRERFRPRTKYLPTRALLSIHREGRSECVCIATDAPYGLYLTNDFVVTHNTKMAIDAACYADKYSPGLVVVVCPNSVRYQWAHQIEKHGWDVFRHEVHVLEGTGLQRGAALLRLTPAAPGTLRWAILNYECLRLLAHNLYESVQHRILILDEVHRIKNPKASVTRIALALEPSYCWGLTGTPVANRLEDIYCLVQRMKPGLLGWNYWQFATRHLIRSKFGMVIRYKEIERIKRAIELVSIGRKKAEVMKDLPPIVSVQVDVNLSAQERGAYNQMVNTMVAWLDGLGDDLTVTEANTFAVRFLRLRQITAGYVSEGVDGEIAWSRDLTKLKAAAEAWEDAGRPRAVFWCQYVPVIKKLEELLPGSFLIHGAVKPAERVRRIQAWEQRADGLLICQMDVAGVGLDLQAGSVQYFVDLPQTPLQRLQCIGRLHRIGQDRTVVVTDVIGRGTVDEVILERLSKKIEIADEVQSGVFGRSRADLLELIGQKEKQDVGS